MKNYALAPLFLLLLLLLLTLRASAQGGYTNHAGNVVAGWPVALTPAEVTLSEGAAGEKPANAAVYPLSIFPEIEQRRIAADFGRPRVPAKVRSAISGSEKAIARSRKRAAKGLCSQEESDEFCAKSQAALNSYLDKQVEDGVITPAERRALANPKPIKGK